MKVDELADGVCIVVRQDEGRRELLAGRYEDNTKMLYIQTSVSAADGQIHFNAPFSNPAGYLSRLIHRPVHPPFHAKWEQRLPKDV